MTSETSNSYFTIVQSSFGSQVLYNSNLNEQERKAALRGCEDHIWSERISTVAYGAGIAAGAVAMAVAVYAASLFTGVGVFGFILAAEFGESYALLALTTLIFTHAGALMVAGNKLPGIAKKAYDQMLWHANNINFYQNQKTQLKG